MDDIAIRIRDRIINKIQDTPGASLDDVWIEAFSESDDEKMNEIRARVNTIVTDDKAAEALKPGIGNYANGHASMTSTSNHSTTPQHTSSTQTEKGVERIDETGVWANGEHYELDCIVLASGFEVHIVHTAHYETYGKSGESLSEHWSDGMKSLHGINIHGFPNLFILGLAQGGNLVCQRDP